MLDRACWTLTAVAVVQNRHDDRAYFANPDNLGSTPIDVSGKKSPAYIRELTNLQYNRGN
jgi:hypothetical protein